MSNLRVVYPGTFDPFTDGHNDLVRRAAAMFDAVTVAVAESQRKAPFFALSDRVDMAREVLSDVRNVEVRSFDCLLNDFLKETGTSVVMRGLRAASDFEYEFQMAGMNRSLNRAIETLFLTPDERFLFVSATMVREIAWFGGDVEQFVHPLVAARIRKRALELNPKLSQPAPAPAAAVAAVATKATPRLVSRTGAKRGR